MPGLTPGRRFQPAYLSFSRQPLPKRLLAFSERQIKGVLFGCRMCGNCLLQETSFICPMECPKGLRNGPCGGSTPAGCYVDPSRPCIWHRIYERAEAMGRADLLMEVLPPLDWSKVGHETWLEVLQKVWARGVGRAFLSLFWGGARRRELWDGVFREIRQPSWWQGDAEPHPPLLHAPVSKLERKLAAKELVVTAEVAPPLSVSPAELASTLSLLKDYIDAANFTDNPSATPRMSSLACSALAVAQGVEPVLQIAARDRTRMGLQAEILGAAALGIRNVLCLTGDHPRLGPSPHGRMDIWDLDSIQMLWLVRRMRDEKHYLDGRTIKNPPMVFLGAAASPFASTPRTQARRELKKSNAGAQFFQSNLVYDLDGFEQYMEALDKEGVLARTPLLVGITPVRSPRAAEAMAQVPGVKVPASLVARLTKARDPKEEGVQIALETIDKVRRMPGVGGFHFMAVGWELIVPRLVKEAGLKVPPRGTAPDRAHAIEVNTFRRPTTTPPKEHTDRRYLALLADKIVVFDGAMGTSLQKLDLSADDFGGERFVGCNDYLVLQKPEVISGVHASYLEVGCDVIETCTFRANRLTMAEYGLEGRVDELNRAAAALARGVADRFASDGRRRFVAGSIGPTGKLPSSSDPELSKISFDELTDVFCEQAESLIEGGCDLLLVETSQDLLEVKAAVVGAQWAFAKTGKKIPLQVQVTLDATGRMLLGTDIAAVLASLERMPIDVIGINCSTGPAEMRTPLSYLGEASSRPISCLPNAGLPQNVNGKAVYPLEPEAFAAQLAGFAEEFGLNVVGGCCGTTPTHIEKLVERVAGKKPRDRKQRPQSLVSSGMSVVSLQQQPPPMLIGERLNAQGSKKAKELLLAEDWEGIAALAREQVEGGAHTLDICVAMTERREEAFFMTQVVKKLSQTVEAPLVIDTTEAEVLEAALKAAPGRIIVNAVNMENGRERLDKMLPLIRDYGAATIALTIDETGMARTAARKLEVAQRIYEIATREFGLEPDALIFDALTFTLATGDPETAGSAVETLEGIRRIKRELPGVLSSLGVSNVSYGFKPAARWALNSVFLHHAVEAGLDMAIVNAKQVTPYAEIPETERTLAEDLLLNRRPDAAARFISFFEGAKKKDATTTDPTAGLSPAERLHWRILHRRPDGIEADVDLLVVAPGDDTAGRAVRALNEVLLPAMKEVGDKFGAGELILPFVLQSAEVMRKAVTHLERYLERVEGVTKGKVVLATVYGDVHDIGKNLIKTILVNNGYTVFDLGKQVPVGTIVDKAVEVTADAIGLSALLVSTSRQMPLVIRELHRRGLAFPVLVGGAAINRDFGRDIGTVDGAVYAGGAFYCKDAFEGLRTIERLVSSKDRGASLEGARVRAGASILPTTPTQRSGISRASTLPPPAEVPTPPFWGHRAVTDLSLATVFNHLDLKRLFRLSWGAGSKQGAEWTALEAELSKRLERMRRETIGDSWLVPKAIYGYFPARAEGNDLLVYDPGDLSRVLQRFAFPRQRGGEERCVADYFRSSESPQPDVVALQVVTVGPAATERFDALDRQSQYSEAYYSHGLAVQTAEATAELVFAQICRELGLGEGRGKRYSWGFAGMGDVDEHRKLFELLPAEHELGMALTSAGQLLPEQSTAALIVHHPGAKYFGA